MIITGTVIHNDDEDYMDVRKKEWNLVNKCYELHMSSGVAKLTMGVHHNDSKEFFRSTGNKHYLMYFALIWQ